MKGMSFFTKRYTKGVPFSLKKWYKKGKALDLGGRKTLLNSPQRLYTVVSLSVTSLRSMTNLFGRANKVSERRVTAVKSRGAWGANYEKLFYFSLT